MEPVTTPPYMLNRDLFVNYYLTEHLPETEAWNAVDEDDLRDAREEIRELWEKEKSTAPKRNESQLEEKFIRPLFRKLGIPFEVEESVKNDQRRPDYGFFRTEKDRQDAFEKREEGGDFYANAIAVADAKRWGRPLDTSGEKREDYANPSFQIDQYLRKTETTWGVLTTGEKWRLYYKPTSHQIDSFYEIDLPEILENGDLEDFKYFYLFFRHQAFIPDASGDTFLDDVQNESNLFARGLGEDLQDNIYEAIKLLAKGFRQHPDNDLGEDDLDLVHDSSLIYLYRLIFILYAEAEGRELLDTNNPFYQRRFSLNQLKQDVAEALDGNETKYPVWDDTLWDQINDLFDLINQGSKGQGIPEDDLSVPAYNGELFRTNPGEDDDAESQFLAGTPISDAYLAKVIERLTRRRDESGEKVFVDYSSLNIRHLGSIYEGLLEYQLNIASEPLTVEDGEYHPASDADEVVVETGDVYLTTDSGERKTTGSYYTPEYVVEYIVESRLEPLVNEIRTDLLATDTHRDTGFASDFAERIFELKILDPAMGSGHFLTNAVNYLAREIIDAQARQIEQEGVDTVDDTRDIYWARRQVAQRCIYGVDLNPLATELAKVSLWLRTLAAEQPLAFLDHHLKTGNSLVGSDIEDVLENGEDDESGDVQLTLHESFEHTRKQALEHVTDRFRTLLNIPNETLDDIKEMEEVYKAVQEDPLYKNLLAMANVHTADEFGLDVPNDAYRRMAVALRDDSWDQVKEQEWFQAAQTMAAEEGFFHWELEFPVAFYGEDGERKDDAGFDAVIGNPPYIRSRNLPDSLKDYYKDNFRSAKGAYDIYIPFLEHAGKIGFQNSFIIPNKWTTTDYGETLRNLFLDVYDLDELVDVSHLDVFPDADIYPLIASYSNRGATTTDEITIRRINHPDEIHDAPGVDVPVEIIDQLGGRVIPVNLDSEFSPLIEKALSRSTKLGDHVEMTEAIHTGNVRSKLVVDEEVDSSCERLADGKSIERYHVKWSGQWIRYDESLIDGGQGEYGDLRSRELFDRDGKLFIRDISYRPVAAFDSNQLFALNTLYSVTPREDSSLSLKYLLGVFNSEFVNQYFRQVYGGTHVSGDYLRFKPMFSYNIPIPEPGDVEELNDQIQQRISVFDSSIDNTDVEAATAGLTDAIREAKETKSELNLNLLDYLGQYTEGESLGEVDGYQPPSGVSSSMVSMTATDFENLKIGTVEVTEENGKLIIHASTRYKPDDPDEYETDPWDYTETDLQPALEFVGLDETEKLLIREFVPYAVEQADGFGGFREDATMTKSVVNRLESIALPSIDDVKRGLERYQEQLDHAHSLDSTIQNADEIIDAITYELFDLSEDQKEFITNRAN